MAYIGNDIQVAYQSYQIIDDISGSFNGSTTSFALLVGGVAPVPFPINEQQCLISVGGVIQEPDPSGTNGFKFSGSNIVFSSAPNTGEDFFGVILAGADYVNVGVNYPSGSESAPSITFDTDLDTGIYNPAANELGFSTNSTGRLFISSDGKIGIGTATPSSYAIQADDLVIAPSTSTAGISLVATTGCSIYFSDLDAEGRGVIQYAHGDDSLRFSSASSQRLLITSNGDVNIVGAGTAGVTQAVSFNGSAPVDSLVVDSSGRLLVGTSTSASAGGNAQYAKLQVFGNTYDDSYGVLNLGRKEVSTSITANEYLGAISFSDQSGNEYAGISAIADAAAGAGDYPGRLVFSTTADGASSPTERMRIGSTGGLRTGRGVTVGNLAVEPNDNILIGSAVISSGAGNSTLKYNTDTGLVSYDTSSRLVKKQIIDCPYGINELKQLQPRKYFRTDDQREEIGFVADEMVQVMPDFVPIGPKSVITKNEEDTEQIPLGVNYEKLTAVLTKALQEAIAKIETLEAKVAALESA